MMNRSFVAFVAATVMASAAQAAVTVKSVETIDVDPNVKVKDDELPPLPHLRMKIGTPFVGLKPGDFSVATDVRDGKTQVVVSAMGEDDEFLNDQAMTAFSTAALRLVRVSTRRRRPELVLCGNR